MIATHKKPETANKKLVNAALRSADKWNSIYWDYHRTIVKKLQLSIAKATHAYVKPATNYTWQGIN